MKNFWNIMCVVVGLVIGHLIGGCIADEREERNQMILRLQKLEQKK
jgi:hypothetical protein